MKGLLKILAFGIDVILMPIRSLLLLEVIITSAILYDASIKVGICQFANEIKSYPSKLKEAAKEVFWKD